MNCRDLETELNPYLDGELAIEDRLDFEAHLGACAPCAQRIEVERRTLALIRLRAKEQSPRAPETLRQRLSLAVADDARHLQRIRWFKVSSVAAGVVLTVTLAHHGYRAFQFRLFEKDAALRHARQLPLEIQQPQALAIEKWFGGKLDHPVTLPQFPNATTAGARMLQVRDKPAAYIRYDAPRPMGLFVYGDDHEVDVGSEAALGTSNGYNVVSWREGDVVYQLVTDLDEDDIRQLLPPRHSPPSSAGSGTPSLRLQPASHKH